ncbi:hypothetical protein HFP89_08190 [Wenzhouxiangella sp. XN79A]|uniref:metallophosphoesterase n=1 Tax=Wenzhouxiangella sp. XN79A TaxID=2724193 RepID=UPI00144A9D17|nr:metallophosphoesterase [Wenzhouxiangella sp. XN79A]NKI35144.1 hypothetical protein [Wenzhouxiangella sp. XN79A]
MEHVFIGDIHGHAPTLLALLERLGWKQRGGRLASPGGQKLVFVGDLIDRGPQNLRTVEIVRDLVERGDALCVMGNHEYNAVQFHTEDPENPGEYLRPRTEGKVRQHRAVLDEIEHRPGDWKDMLAWLRQLPLALEGEGWRCVHACWHPGHLEALERRSGGWYLPENRWVAAARGDTPEYAAVETLLKGPEYELPDGAGFFDKGGQWRRHARIAWWEPEPATLGEALLFQSPPEGLDCAAGYRNPDHPAYPEVAPPVFFGHYWRSGSIEPERANAVCLDYSIGKGQRLAAYRYSGELQLRSDGFRTQSCVS